ncbi:FAD-dependent oxidoreductase [Actinocrinis sp.]|uniref:FAD-dependent oxidoreductase n=1 Tax=Actinocrinis sp. TaxID=1920516 RepID=UPI002D73DB5E|nr:FAD-dependent oxidoreductase [Actinocrinis sp.]HZP52342.1 FAD-dependent oxidoreductase [Actinocrinis sp.]
MGEITVIGAGVIGLSIAHELAAAGHRVRILAAQDAAGSVSAVAAAIWFPHDVDPSAQVLDSAQVTYHRLERLARRPETGVRMRAGTVLVRRADTDTSWTRAVPGCEVLGYAQLPGGIAAAEGTSGLRCTMPLAVTGAYLRWLRAAVLALGVRMHVTEVRSVQQVLEQGEPDAVVVACGIRSAALLGDDDQTFPIRGQVVRLLNPGLTEWVIDDDNPEGLTYVVPRDRDVVCGGTDEPGSWDERVNPETEQAILRRVRALVPALAAQPIVSRAVGLRPARSTVRLGAVAGYDRPVFACYGHGGAGFTLSWGDAARIAALIGPA